MVNILRKLFSSIVQKRKISKYKNKVAYLKTKYFFFHDFSEGRLTAIAFIEYLNQFTADLSNDENFPIQEAELEEIKQRALKINIVLGSPVDLEHIIPKEQDDDIPKALDNLIGIGVTHLHDVRDYTIKVLERLSKRSKIDIITIEAKVYTLKLGPVTYQIPEVAKIDPGVVRLNRVLKEKNREEYYINDSLFITMTSYDGMDAALVYALQFGIPVYFIDNPFADGSTIAGFHKARHGKYL